MSRKFKRDLDDATEPTRQQGQKHPQPGHNIQRQKIEEWAAAGLQSPILGLDGRGTSSVYAHVTVKQQGSNRASTQTSIVGGPFPA